MIHAWEKRLGDWLCAWEAEGGSRTALAGAGQALVAEREALGIHGLWEVPPIMLAATLDDGWGRGLEVIRSFASAAGMDVRFLGLCQGAEAILSACRELSPALVGLTVLQGFSDEDLIKIGKNLAPGTLLVAGGAAFSADPDLAETAGVDFVARDAAGFLRFLLDRRADIAPGF
ncbi:MAG: cobalamin B12-binding domain-containing protein [Proteobacteria bacterium]|nr:cobalamin B12-binding domain-containing protein [Pseudomonadota bacterium]